jgi:hypothetical protein
MNPENDDIRAAARTFDLDMRSRYRRRAPSFVPITRQGVDRSGSTNRDHDGGRLPSPQTRAPEDELLYLL